MAMSMPEPTPAHLSDHGVNLFCRGLRPRLPAGSERVELVSELVNLLFAGRAKGTGGKRNVCPANGGEVSHEAV